MKNLLKNIFKTLFFFDLIVIIDHYFINFKHKSDDIMLFYNQLALAVLVVAFTLFFYFWVEKRKIKIPIKTNAAGSAIAGAVGGLLLPALSATVLVFFGKVEFLGFNKLPFMYFIEYNLPSIILGVIFSELLLRGYLFSLYKKHYGFWASAIITTALWLAINPHLLSGNKLLLLNLVLLNLLICSLYELTGSFLSVLVARFVYLLISTFALGSIATEGIPLWLKTKGFNDYGLEGSLAFTVIALAFLYFFLYVKYDINNKVKACAVTTANKIKNFNFKDLTNGISNFKKNIFKK